jgi:hypothetical protein
MKIKIPLSFLGTLLITAFGAYASFAMFHFLAVKGLQAKTVTTKDTVLVRLLNANLPNGPATQELQSNHGVQSQDTTRLAGRLQSGTGDTGRISRRSAPPVIPIDANQQASAIQAAELKITDFPIWLLILAVVLILAGVFYVLYYNLPYFTDEMNRDMDPPKLTELFSRHGNEFLQLGNPRKIKRLSNKLRFQYHYLELKGLDHPKDLDQLCRILLMLENRPLPDRSNEPPKKIRSVADFKKWLQSQKMSPLTEKLIQLIFALNREALMEVGITGITF